MMCGFTISPLLRKRRCNGWPIAAVRGEVAESQAGVYDPALCAFSRGSGQTGVGTDIGGDRGGLEPEWQGFLLSPLLAKFQTWRDGATWSAKCHLLGVMVAQHRAPGSNKAGHSHSWPSRRRSRSPQDAAGFRDGPSFLPSCAWRR
jgi:hypothetical protein